MVQPERKPIMSEEELRQREKEAAKILEKEEKSKEAIRRLKEYLERPREQLTPIGEKARAVAELYNLRKMGEEKAGAEYEKEMRKDLNIPNEVDLETAAISYGYAVDVEKAMNKSTEAAKAFEKVGIDNPVVFATNIIRWNELSSINEMAPDSLDKAEKKEFKDLDNKLIEQNELYYEYVAGREAEPEKVTNKITQPPKSFKVEGGRIFITE